jgi:hypothetical protein
VRFLAYLDANSGSMIAAAVAGGLAGVAVVVKLWWRRVTGVFSPKRRAAARAAEANTAEAGTAGAADKAVAATTAANTTDIASSAVQAPVEK